ncbi:MAG: RMD1 family protein [Alphaproteobacteria bacterium]|nr:RMD1 family protein [Alphaproteobacteria bacterium]
MTNEAMHIRALQLGDRIEVKGLEREDAFSSNPLAFRTRGGGRAAADPATQPDFSAGGFGPAVVLFKSGAAVFINMTPVEEEDVIRSLGARIVEPLAERESETAQIVIRPDEDGITSPTGAIQLKAADSNRLLLVAEALAVSVALAHDERRIARAFERLEPVASSLVKRRLPPGPKAALLGQIGEALHIQQRLAERVDLDEKPDLLWDHPELERFWAKLVDEYDLPQRARAIERRLAVIRETADTITDLISTRTSHRLEWYIIALIALEIALGLWDRFTK